MQKSESNWDRAKRDTELFRKNSSRWFWGVEVLGGAALAASSNVLTPISNEAEKWLITFFVFIFGSGLIYLIILLFHFIRAPYNKALAELANELEKNKQLESQIAEFAKINIESDLKVYAKANKILPFNYDAKAFGNSEFFNGRQFIVDVTLSSSKRMKIDLIEIELCGIPYKAKEQINDYIKDFQSYQFTFDVPPEVAINTNDVRIKAWSNNQPYVSNLFEINFNESLK